MNIEDAVSKVPECRRSELSHVSKQQSTSTSWLESCVQIAWSRSAWSSYAVPPIQTLGHRTNVQIPVAEPRLLLMISAGSAARRLSPHACTTL